MNYIKIELDSRFKILAGKSMADKVYKKYVKGNLKRKRNVIDFGSNVRVVSSDFAVRFLYHVGDCEIVGTNKVMDKFNELRRVAESSEFRG